MHGSPVDNDATWILPVTFGVAPGLMTEFDRNADAHTPKVCTSLLYAIPD